MADVHGGLAVTPAISHHGADDATGKIGETVRLVAAEHRVVLVLVMAYIAAGGIFLTGAHRPWPLTFYDSLFGVAWITLSAVWLLWQYIRSPRRLCRAMVPVRVAAALLIPTIAIPTEITFQSLKQSFGPVRGFVADPVLHQLDIHIHGRMAWQWLTPLLRHARLVAAVDTLYFGWFGALMVFVLWASWSRHRELRQRAVTAFLLLWILAGTLVAGFASSGGPCYFGKIVAGPNPYQPLLTRLDAIGDAGNPLQARRNQNGLWALRQSDRWGFFAGISAMPSLHVAIAVLYVIITSRRSRMLALLLAMYAVVIDVGSVMLGWHYAVDGYMGALLAYVCWRLAGWLLDGPDSEAAQRVEALIARRRCA